jgi:hypothetical protein
MLDVAVRHDALAVNPVRGTTWLHRAKQEARALRSEDLITVRAAVRAWMVQDRPGPKPTSDMPTSWTLCSPRGVASVRSWPFVGKTSTST